jgi:photosystem I subunit III
VDKVQELSMGALKLRDLQVASRPVSVRKVSVRRSAKVVCSAQRPESRVQQVGTAVAAAALAAVVGLGGVEAAYADISGLTPCAESKAFAKREKNELKQLTRRQKLVRLTSLKSVALILCKHWFLQLLFCTVV